MSIPRALLSVDWDYFFPLFNADPKLWGLYDWGHRDAGKFFIEMIWGIRAEGFIKNGLPLPGTSGAEKTFWDRFTFHPTAKLYIAESHVDAIKPEVHGGYMSEVWNYDAHHDCGYEKKIVLSKLDNVDCGNWMLGYRKLFKSKLHVRYPEWRSTKQACKEATPSFKPNTRMIDDMKEKNPLMFRNVFLCRSGGWSPAWLDKDFLNFIDACPVREKIFMDDSVRTARDYSNHFSSTDFATGQPAEKEESVQSS